MTKQRMLIMNIIRSSCLHLTAEQIFLKAREQLPNIAIGTVYRNLKLLCDSGDIRRIDIGSSPDHYDKNPHPHEHLICDSCGRLDDIKVDGLISRIEEKIDTKVLSYELTIHYICKQCRGE